MARRSGLVLEGWIVELDRIDGHEPTLAMSVLHDTPGATVSVHVQRPEVWP